MNTFRHFQIRARALRRSQMVAFTTSAMMPSTGLAAAVFFVACLACLAADGSRKDIQINSGWRAAANDINSNSFPGFEQPGFDDSAWRPVDVPHNWDDYHGFHQVKHGNRHGYAWYRRAFGLSPADRERRIFLWFEGVGSYATVWVNGKLVGNHAGGRTSFTLDVTDAAKFDAPNLLAVRADHPVGIQDLPWVCGGCDYRTGFSEGSQPMGIFRPVHVVVTSPVRVEPFGVRVWNGNDISAQSAIVHINTEVKNYGATRRQVRIVNRLMDRNGAVVAEMRSDCSLPPGATEMIEQTTPKLANPHLWSLDDPYLYQVRTEIVEDGNVLDAVETPFGIRWIEWPAEASTNQPFRLNGKPVFINGTCEYEHLLGGSHAFAAEQIRARVMQFRAAGFNAFRDAHQPHNLRYHEYWDRLGVLWWPQMAAQIWFDTPEFKTNFTNLLRDWVKERRNSPSLVLWGLANESKLPEEFAKECAAIIRELDPTASSQRKITTCNGGKGADWNVPQNWTGTYGGDPDKYADDARKQRLIGEYGGFRSIDYHEECPFDLAKNQPKLASEDRFAALMETKVRLAESVKTQFCGHFQWLLASHDNPGRTADGCSDGIREMDQIGVVNNKGLLTSWGEPLDAFYMFRANYAPRDTQPMVYIASHTWPDRWTMPGKKRGIVVYSNCDSVELFNDFKTNSLGKQTHGGIGTHFQWDDVDIQNNVLYAEGSVDGKVVATDIILLNHLPPAPYLGEFDRNKTNLTAPAPGQNYLYRVNCGGPEYTDANGNTWMADHHLEPGDSWGSLSWADGFPDVAPEFASMRKLSVPIAETTDDQLFQTYRYGRDKLQYRFAVPDGDYNVELYFVEPWYGAGGGLNCTGWRLFDVAINDAVVLTNVDIWKEAGFGRALKKVVPARAANGALIVSFPRVASYQAVISAIAIASTNAAAGPPPMSDPLITHLHIKDETNAVAFSARTCLDVGDRQFGDADGRITVLPPRLVDANWIRTADGSRRFRGAELMRFNVADDAEVFVAHDQRIQPKPVWLADWMDMNQTLENNRAGGAKFELFRKQVTAGSTVSLGENGTGNSTNAGMYTVIVKRSLPPVPPRWIREISVGSAANPGDWSALGKLRAGDLQYSHENRVVTSMPSALFNSDWIRTPMRVSGDEALHFTVSENVDVYVALNSRVAPVPNWLSGWINTGRTLSNSDTEAGRFLLFKRRFSRGGAVDLGGIGESPAAASWPMYTVLVNEARPSSLYPAASAQLSGPTLVKDVPGGNGAGCIEFKHSAGNSVEWTITVGVADTYGLRFRYASDGAAAIPMNLEIVDAAGKILSARQIELPPPRVKGSWDFVQANTGVNINAGTYKVRLTSIDSCGLVLDSLEVE